MTKRRKRTLIGLAVLAACGVFVLNRVRLWGEDHVFVMTGDHRWAPNCLTCHMGAGVRPAVGWRDIEPYRSPRSIAVSPDGSRLYITANGCDKLLVADARSRGLLAEVPVGRRPHGVCLTPDGRKAYVTNRWDHSVSEIDTGTLQVTRTIRVGQGPAGIAVTPDGSTLYTANSFADDVSVVDLKAGEERARLAAGRRPMAIALTPDGKQAYVTSMESLPVEFRTVPMTEVTVIDVARNTVTDRKRFVSAHMVEGIAMASSYRGVDGKVRPPLALTTLVRPKNLVPAVQVARGWMITDGMGIIRLDASPESIHAMPAGGVSDQQPDDSMFQVLLDDPNAFYADPCDIVATPDGRRAYVSHSGTDTVTAIDIEKLRGVLNDPADRRTLAESLAFPREFVTARIKTDHCPRGLAVSPDGKFVYVADSLADRIQVIAIDSNAVVGAIDLKGPKRTTLMRQGEIIFHNAGNTFQNQFSCRSCHLDGINDGLTYELESNGIGVNIVDNRSLQLVSGTAPLKWNGVSSSLYRQCGARFAAFITRSDVYSPDQLAALVAYINNIPPYPNRYRSPDGKLTDAQKRGKAIFERTVDNSGNNIPRLNRCITCHRPPFYTDHLKHDVDTAGPTDTKRDFDTAHLMNIYQTAPYLHDGRAQTLEEIWTRYGPTNKHGAVNDLLKEQLNDLVEYLKTL